MPIYVNIYAHLAKINAHKLMGNCRSCYMTIIVSSIFYAGMKYEPLCLTSVLINTIWRFEEVDHSFRIVKIHFLSIFNQSDSHFQSLSLIDDKDAGGRFSLT